MEQAAKLMETEESGAASNELAEVSETPAQSDTIDDLISINEKSVYQNSDGEIIVETEHPDIQAAIEKAVEDASKQTVSLPPSDYIKVLLNELDKIRKERAKFDSTAIR